MQDNLWTNPGEIPKNGIDDDGNGYIDDVHGYNFVDDNAIWSLIVTELMWRVLLVRQIIMKQVSAALQEGTELPAVGELMSCQF